MTAVQEKGGTTVFNQEIYNDLCSRMNRYKDGVSYAKNVLGNMKIAMQLLDEAEKLK
jgi:hypothetical protein